MKWDEIIDVTPREIAILQILEKVKMTSPTALRLLLHYDKFSLYRYLAKLRALGLVYMPIKGLVIHSGWLENHPEEKAYIQEQIGYRPNQ